MLATAAQSSFFGILVVPCFYYFLNDLSSDIQFYSYLHSRKLRYVLIIPASYGIKKERPAQTLHDAFGRKLMKMPKRADRGVLGDARHLYASVRVVLW